jgi:hypothetical protein
MKVGCFQVWWNLLGAHTVMLMESKPPTLVLLVDCRKKKQTYSLSDSIWVCLLVLWYAGPLLSALSIQLRPLFVCALCVPRRALNGTQLGPASHIKWKGPKMRCSNRVFLASCLAGGPFVSPSLHYSQEIELVILVFTNISFSQCEVQNESD